MKAKVQDIHTLAPSQRGMLLESAHGAIKGGLFIEQTVLSVRGHLDRSRFLAAVERTAETHASLRCCFAWDAEQPVQVVFERIQPEVAWEDWRNTDDADNPQALTAWLDEDRARGVAVNRAPLWRFAVIRLRDDAYRVVWTHHHLITDGWSIAVVLSDLLTCYEGVRPVPPARPLRDYVNWIDAQDAAAAAAFWRQRLSALPRLPPMAPRASGDGFAEVTDIDASALLDVARAHGVAFAITVFAAWALVLRAFRATGDVVFGVTTHGRPATLAGVERIVGPFISTFPLHVRMTDMATVGELLGRIEAMQREQRPFEYLSSAEVHQAAAVATRLYDTLVVVEHLPQQDAPADAGLSVAAEAGSGARSHHPLLLRVSPDGIARLLYNRRFIDDAMAAGLASLLREAAARLAADDGLPRLADPAIPLAVAQPAASRAPETPQERVVVALARDLFGGHAGLDDSFFDLGGHSLLAVDFLHRIATATGVRLPLTQLLHDARLGAIAQALAERLAGNAGSSSAPRIFFVPGNPGSPLYAARLAAHLGGPNGWRLHGLEAPGLDGAQAPLPSVEALAEHHLASLSDADDPAVLVGHSFGGWVAFEMGLRLQASGRAVVVILLDTLAPHRLPSRGDVGDAGLRAEVARLASRANDAGFAIHVTPAAFAVYAAARRATYAPSARAEFPLALFRAARAHPEDGWDRSDSAYGWTELCRKVHVDCVDGDHLSMMAEPAVEVLAERIGHWLRQLEG
ncbi:condensation domain-containing protein [Burkholderia thailandensis]|uniref:Phosphopantetheine attachment site family protein n=1 Tax=Burkholderia thailandensis TaxID=57975 RepID=A0AAW9D0Q5_BURTH|nr:alpha/beta fold hydrolase [Burkholderia thailandensis]AHI64040.1 thioesterase domain protein [Burkholderia thailandensis H0587]AOJ50923.1 peptide synthetase [Burkholderia thailandensis]AVR26350.1 peptide synthetase [Burkholderia thailandensis]MCS3391515.1 condensation domain-containing protein [Burkholderia thailandensis]MCS6423777.1 condensation domain-containing protein [Burkholderia thailandensis]